jgi:hypothetical protein
MAKKAASSASTATKRVKAEPPATSRVTRHEIGNVAGQLWRLLDQNGELSLSQIKKVLDVPDDLAVAAMGWLACEDKLDFSAHGRSVKVKLRRL